INTTLISQFTNQNTVLTENENNNFNTLWNRINTIFQVDSSGYPIGGYAKLVDSKFTTLNDSVNGVWNR
ncbi:hypothetical protein, partial [Klebsiella pneumoniae]|uniref:hypothetical protein n=1 Tax=Klebsiella pneumoniae TaxID=573 RepID=UPI001D0E11D0